MPENLILASLPKEDMALIEPFLEKVDVRLHDVLVEPGDKIDYVYFPLDCMVSMVTLLESGASIEAATIGSEGMTGLSTYLGLEVSRYRAFSQMQGTALKLSTRDFRDALDKSRSLELALGRYADALIAMLAQSSACNGLHSQEQRLARWLLTIADRVDREDYHVTQDFLSQMLGTHRPTVTLTAGQLQSAGFIRYRRGFVEILDRESMQEIACECYGIIRELYDETFHRVGD